MKIQSLYFQKQPHSYQPQARTQPVHIFNDNNANPDIHIINNLNNKPDQ